MVGSSTINVSNLSPSFAGNKLAKFIFPENNAFKSKCSSSSNSIIPTIASSISKRDSKKSVSSSSSSVDKVKSRSPERFWSRKRGEAISYWSIAWVRKPFALASCPALRIPAKFEFNSRNDSAETLSSASNPSTCSARRSQSYPD